MSRPQKLNKPTERLLRCLCEKFAEQKLSLPEFMPGQAADAVMELVQAGFLRFVLVEESDDLHIVGHQYLVDGEVVGEVRYGDQAADQSAQ
jgi:hypothetical protein